ncbi:MAG: hypothetical protein AAF618_01960 [Pseudomonadota bacterium]
MAAPDLEPLGFSDLDQDEELLIILYREWRRRGAGAVVEHAIARNMRRHGIYGLLEMVFGSFSAVTEAPKTWRDPGLLLTRSEERLLTLMAYRLPRDPALTIRCAGDIERSGRDRLRASIDRAYWQTVMPMGGGPSRLN